jgi:hypothetical protein
MITVVVEGGLVTAVVSDDPALIGKSFTVVDYDIEGADEVDQVEQSDGELVDAVVWGDSIEKAAIRVV